MDSQKDDQPVTPPTYNSKKTGALGPPPLPLPPLTFNGLKHPRMPLTAKRSMTQDSILLNNASSPPSGAGTPQIMRIRAVQKPNPQQQQQQQQRQNTQNLGVNTLALPRSSLDSSKPPSPLLPPPSMASLTMERGERERAISPPLSSFSYPASVRASIGPNGITVANSAPSIRPIPNPVQQQVGATSNIPVRSFKESLRAIAKNVPSSFLRHKKNLSASTTGSIGPGSISNGHYGYNNDVYMSDGMDTLAMPSSYGTTYSRGRMSDEFIGADPFRSDSRLGREEEEERRLEEQMYLAEMQEMDDYDLRRAESPVELEEREQEDYFGSAKAPSIEKITEEDFQEDFQDQDESLERAEDLMSQESHRSKPPVSMPSMMRRDSGSIKSGKSIRKKFINTQAFGRMASATKQRISSFAKTSGEATSSAANAVRFGGLRRTPSAPTSPVNPPVQELDEDHDEQEDTINYVDKPDEDIISLPPPLPITPPQLELILPESVDLQIDVTSFGPKPEPKPFRPRTSFLLKPDPHPLAPKLPPPWPIAAGRGTPKPAAETTPPLAAPAAPAAPVTNGPRAPLWISKPPPLPLPPRGFHPLKSLNIPPPPPHSPSKGTFAEAKSKEVPSASPPEKAPNVQIKASTAGRSANRISTSPARPTTLWVVANWQPSDLLDEEDDVPSPVVYTNYRRTPSTSSTTSTMRPRKPTRPPPPIPGTAKSEEYGLTRARGWDDAADQANSHEALNPSTSDSYFHSRTGQKFRLQSIVAPSPIEIFPTTSEGGHSWTAEILSTSASPISAYTSTPSPPPIPSPVPSPPPPTLPVVRAASPAPIVVKPAPIKATPVDQQSLNSFKVSSIKHKEIDEAIRRAKRLETVQLQEETEDEPEQDSEEEEDDEDSDSTEYHSGDSTVSTSDSDSESAQKVPITIISQPIQAFQPDPPSVAPVTVNKPPTQPRQVLKKPRQTVNTNITFKQELVQRSRTPSDNISPTRATHASHSPQPRPVPERSNTVASTTTRIDRKVSVNYQRHKRTTSKRQTTTQRS